MKGLEVPHPWSRGDSLCALTVVVLWGLNFVGTQIGLQGLNPMLLGALRFSASSLPFLWWVGRPLGLVVNQTGISIFRQQSKNRS